VLCNARTAYHHVTPVSQQVAHSGYDNYVAELQTKAAGLKALQFHVKPSKISKLKHRRQESCLSDVSTSMSVSSDSDSSDNETNSMRGCTNRIVDGNGGDCQVSWLDEKEIPQTVAQQNHAVAQIILLSKALEALCRSHVCKLANQTGKQRFPEIGGTRSFAGVHASSLPKASVQLVIRVGFAIYLTVRYLTLTNEAGLS